MRGDGGRGGGGRDVEAYARDASVRGGGGRRARVDAVEFVRGGLEGFRSWRLTTRGAFER